VPVDIAHLETATPVIERAIAVANASRGCVRLLYVHPILPFTYLEFAPEVHMRKRRRRSKRSRQRCRCGGARMSAVRSGSVDREVLE